MSEVYKINLNVRDACRSHWVWCPNDCRKVLIPPLEERLKQMINEVCEEQQAHAACIA